MNNDIINHPSHYTDGKIEVIDFIEDKKLNFHRGNAIKYISRAGKKDPQKEIEDLEKAIWYLNIALSLFFLFGENVWKRIFTDIEDLCFALKTAFVDAGKERHTQYPKRKRRATCLFNSRGKITTQVRQR